jgi:chorismate dehydratase
MPPRIRLGAVDYLNARPLVHGLGARADRYDLRFDPPSRCAALLHEGSIDVGMIPSIEYLRGDGYQVVPGVSIASLGEVASVALFTAKRIAQVRTIALDSSSRTSAALLQILCARLFGISPSFETLAPDFATMLKKADAALVIGDPALFATSEAAGLEKIDLGEAWRGLTGLPFVWAFWAGRAGVLEPADVRTLRAARDAGVADGDAIAEAYGAGDPLRIARGQAYLRNNMRYGLGEAEHAGLDRFYELASEQGLARKRPVAFFGGTDHQYASQRA